MAAANSSDTSNGPAVDSGAVSTRSKSYGAKMLFWYLRLFFTMGFSAAATATLWYQFINNRATAEKDDGGAMITIRSCAVGSSGASRHNRARIVLSIRRRETLSRCVVPRE